MRGIERIKKSIVTRLSLDLLESLQVTSSVLKAVVKIVSFLDQCIAHSIDVKQWSNSSKKPGEIPQPENTCDFGILICLSARCLATRCCMISQTNILAFRQQMIQELHQKKLSSIPPLLIQPGE